MTPPNPGRYRASQRNTATRQDGVPSSAGAHTFSARATFAGLPPVDKEFSVSVVGPWLVTTSLADGQVSDSYSQSLVADVHYPEFGQNHPGRPAISGFELGVGSLPDGLTLNTSNGLISGIPTADGAHDFTVLVHDTAGNTGSRGYSLTIGTPSRAHLHFQAVTTPVGLSTHLGPFCSLNLAPPESLLPA